MKKFSFTIAGFYDTALFDSTGGGVKMIVSDEDYHVLESVLTKYVVLAYNDGQGKGGIKLWAGVSSLVPTDNHNLSLPAWIKAGNIITDGTAHQRIAAVTDGSVIFEWLNGGYFDVNITAVLQSWTPSDSRVCEIREAA